MRQPNSALFSHHIAPYAILLILVFGLIAVIPPLLDLTRPASCMPDDCFCEVMHPEGPAQPVNSLSSLAYVLVGLWVLWTTPTTARSARQPWRGLFVFALVFIGLGSAYYHATFSFTGQFFDFFGMLLLVGFMLVYNWARRYNFTEQASLSVYLLLMLTFALLLVYIPDTRRSLFALVLIVALVFEFLHYRRQISRLQVRWLLAGLGLFAVAYLIWILDANRTWCDPLSLIQGHAVWHLLGAAASGLLWRYYQSETSREPA